MGVGVKMSSQTGVLWHLGSRGDLANRGLFSEVRTSPEGAMTHLVQVETRIREGEFSVGNGQFPYSLPGGLEPNATPSVRRESVSELPTTGFHPKTPPRRHA